MGSNHRKNKGNHSHRNNNNQGGGGVGTTTPASPVSSTSSSGGNHHHPKSHPRRNNSGRSSSTMPPSKLQTVSSGGSSSTTTKAADPTTDAAFWMAEVLEEEEEMEKNNQSTMFRLSCREILVVALVLLALLAVSMFLGIAAGISVSVQFYDTEGTGLSSGGGSLVGLEDSFLPHRVTISEPSIVMGGSHHGGAARTKPVLAGSSSSSRLSVVEESPRLQSTTTTLVDGSVLLDSPADLGEWNDQTTTTTTKGNNSPSLPIPPRMGSLDDWVRTKPVLCLDGQTIGYDSWNSLKAAVQDVNRYSAERYELWHDYFVEVVKMQQASGTECTLANPACRTPHTFDDNSLYYEEEIVMTICPGAKLRKLFRGPIFVNTESMVFECDGCTIRGLGTHMSFGPEAKNVLVRGITFSHATSSSLTFYYDGAEVSFENCHFVNNRARMASWGALADVNSTAVVNFYHCSVTKPWGRRHELSSSLSIRAGP